MIKLVWCNGNTAVSKTADKGSIPLAFAKYTRKDAAMKWGEALTTGCAMSSVLVVIIGLYSTLTSTPNQDRLKRRRTEREKYKDQMEM